MGFQNALARFLVLVLATSPAILAQANNYTYREYFCSDKLVNVYGTSLSLVRRLIISLDIR